MRCFDVDPRSFRQRKSHPVFHIRIRFPRFGTNRVQVRFERNWIDAVLSCRKAPLCTSPYNQHTAENNRSIKRGHHGHLTILLSWFSMHEHLVIHVVFASITFVGAYVWSYSMHASRSHKPGTGYSKRRVWLAVGGMSYLVMNLSLAQSARRLVIEQGLTGGTEVMNLAQSSIDIAAPAEYLFFLSVVLMLASFDHDLAEARQDEATLGA